MRASAVEASGLSVGADLFVCTEAESEQIRERSAWLRHVLGEVLWLE